MHVLFVHTNFPAQFGHLADHLVREHGYRCTFASERPGPSTPTLRRIYFKPSSGATRASHFFARTFENQMFRSEALFRALQAAPDCRPDLIVGHSGFVSTLFLRELYDCPQINYFEYFYRTRDADIDFRADLVQPTVEELNRARARNATLLLDLENCDAGYAATEFQRSRMPHEFREKLSTIFDGIDTQRWCPRPHVPRQVAGRSIPQGCHVITYVSRGFESMRGFDRFLDVASRVSAQRRDVVFVVVGEDRVAYGSDQRWVGEGTFKSWALERYPVDQERVWFVGRLAPDALADLLSISTLHLYWTAPFVLSWSLMNALACGTLVAASRTPPVEEMIRHGENGLLFDFFDTEETVSMVSDVLDRPQAYDELRTQGIQMIRDRYSLDVCLPRLVELFSRVRASHVT